MRHLWFSPICGFFYIPIFFSSKTTSHSPLCALLFAIPHDLFTLLVWLPRHKIIYQNQNRRALLFLVMGRWVWCAVNRLCAHAKEVGRGQTNMQWFCLPQTCGQFRSLVLRAMVPNLFSTRTHFLGTTSCQLPPQDWIWCNTSLCM